MDFAALTQPFVFNDPAKKATTTLPDLPFGALWMWEAFTLLIPFTFEKVQQTLRVPALSVITALPDPLGAPFGTSLLPSMVVVSVIVPAETAASASAGRHSRPSRQTTSTRARIGPPIGSGQPTLLPGLPAQRFAIHESPNRRSRGYRSGARSTDGDLGPAAPYGQPDSRKCWARSSRD